MEIISKRERVEVAKFALGYRWRDDPQAGFGFDCDENGNVLLDQMGEAALDNLRKCEDGTYDVVRVGVENFSYSYINHAVGKCSCGREVTLAYFTNACECGRDYNSSGMLLAHRSQWGEETGESLADILRIP
jgi:hypothetical protein